MGAEQGYRPKPNEVDLLEPQEFQKRPWMIGFEEQTGELFEQTFNRLHWIENKGFGEIASTFSVSRSTLYEVVDQMGLEYRDLKQSWEVTRERRVKAIREGVQAFLSNSDRVGARKRKLTKLYQRRRMDKAREVLVGNNLKGTVERLLKKKRSIRGAAREMDMGVTAFRKLMEDLGVSWEVGERKRVVQAKAVIPQERIDLVQRVFNLGLHRIFDRKTRIILQKRYPQKPQGRPLTLEETGRILKMSREAVRQREDKALRILERLIESLD